MITIKKAKAFILSKARVFEIIRQTEFETLARIFKIEAVNIKFIEIHIEENNKTKKLENTVCLHTDYYNVDKYFKSFGVYETEAEAIAEKERLEKRR